VSIDDRNINPDDLASEGNETPENNTPPDNPPDDDGLEATLVEAPVGKILVLNAAAAGRPINFAEIPGFDYEASSARNTSGGFNYEQVAGPFRDDLRNCAANIRRSLKFEREARFTVGQELTRAKAMLTPHHGLWCQWIQDEFAMSHATACRYMRLYEVLGDDEFRSVRNLPIKAETFYRLTSARTASHVVPELADDINTGALAAHHPALDEEINRRINEGRSAGMGKTEPSAAERLDMRRRDFGIAATALIKRWALSSGATQAEFKTLSRQISRAGYWFAKCMRAEIPQYREGVFLYKGPVGAHGKMTDAELMAAQLASFSEPEQKEWEPSYDAAHAENERRSRKAWEAVYDEARIENNRRSKAQQREQQSDAPDRPLTKAECIAVLRAKFDRRDQIDEMAAAAGDAAVPIAEPTSSDNEDAQPDESDRAV
jgi:hypothetical protein